MVKSCPACNYLIPEDVQVCPYCDFKFDSDMSGKREGGLRRSITGLSTGDLIAGRYMVERDLGRGTMGVVYLVHDIDLAGEEVALKIIYPELLADPQAQKDFVGEVINCRKLTHNSIVRVHHLERWQGLWFLTMEYLPGRNLKELLDKRKENVPPFSLLEVISVLNPVLEALGCAHNYMIHRNLKPANIMVIGEFPNIEIKVLDFGIIKAVPRWRFSRTAHDPGRTDYMAPEQINGAGEIDHRADLFSLGIILYEMLTGAIPAGAREPPSALCPGIPAELDDLVMRLLKDEPEERYATAQEVRNQLTCFTSVQEKGIGEFEQAEAAGDEEVLVEGLLKEGLVETASLKKDVQAEETGVQEEAGDEEGPAEADHGTAQEVKDSDEVVDEAPDLAGLDEGAAQQGIDGQDQDLLLLSDEQAEKETGWPHAEPKGNKRRARLVAGSVLCLLLVGLIGVWATRKGAVEIRTERSSHTTRPPRTVTYKKGAKDKDAGPVRAEDYVAAENEAGVTRVGIEDTVAASSSSTVAAKGRLYVDTVPDGATIRIANIGPKYQRGMELEAGPYCIEVTHPGYETYKEWVELASGEERRVDVRLKEIQPARLFTNSIGMEFMLIPAGDFMMGSPLNEAQREEDERRHKVTISRPFYMQTTEVGQGQWRRVMGQNPSHFDKCGDACPVENVSWNDVQVFIRKLNRREGGEKYRLPTEAEWEYAMRSGSGKRFSWGDNADCSKMMYENDAGSRESRCVEYVRARGLAPDSTAPSKSYPPNAWGLYDMSGNVWEWCQDWYAVYPAGHVIDPKGPASGSRRVSRGGGWDNGVASCRSAIRDSVNPDGRYYNLGFRLVAQVAR